MRPPEFTGGNLATVYTVRPSDHQLLASMRPPEFTGGNWIITGVAGERYHWLQ